MGNTKARDIKKTCSPRGCTLRTIKSDVVVGLGSDGDKKAKKLDEEEPGWKISGKYVSNVNVCVWLRLTR
jgi:hypothetical protein